MENPTPAFSLTRSATSTDGAAVRFLFQGNRLLVKDDDPLEPVAAGNGRNAFDWQPIDLPNGRTGYVSEAPASFAAPPGFHFVHLRQLLLSLGEAGFANAGRARQLLTWIQTSRYCGRCGAPMETGAEPLARVCPKCDQSFFPRVSPAVIVAVRRKDRLLLARSSKFNSTLFSVLAGFVEPGETLEACVAREVREEVGIELNAIRYFGSQPWPFPHSLMVGFTARYAGGKLRADGEEIVEADWFDADHLPPIPPPGTISRNLIDWFVRRARRMTASTISGT